MPIATNSTFLLLERHVNNTLSEEAVELLWEKIFEKPFLLNVLLVLVLCRKWNKYDKRSYRPAHFKRSRTYLKVS